MTNKGFTLLELLVAMAIFAVIAVMTAQGLSGMIKTRERMEEEGDRLAVLQNAVAIMSRDFEQIIDRPIRDEYGISKPALIGGDREQGNIEFSRGGFRNPAVHARSSMERVSYRLTDRTLVRTSWPVLDRVPTSSPASRTLLTGVDDFNVRFMDSAKQWQNSWPLESNSADIKPHLPQAVEVTFSLEDWGTITRLFLPAWQRVL